jgi:hypothetical protein
MLRIQPLAHLLTTTFLLFSSGVVVVAQGQIVFSNRITNAIIAPVYGVELSDSTLSKQGNTVSGTPAGNQTYTGALLAGSGYTAQLFGGTTNTATEDLTALSPTTVFRIDDGAGFIIAPPNALTVPGVPEGQPAKIQVRTWQNSGGITNWQQVLANPEIPRGESSPFISPPLGGIYFAPPNLTGLQSFNLALPSVQSDVIRLLSASYLTNGNFSFSFTAPTNRSYTVEASADLTNWSAIVTNLVVSDSPWTFEDTNATLLSNQFYRLTWP